MRAVVCAVAILSSISRSARMRVPIPWEFASPHGLEKSSRHKLSDYARQGNTVSLFSGLLLLILFVFLVCVVDSGWKSVDERWSWVQPTAVLARPRRALQSSSEAGFETGPNPSALHGMGVTFRIGSRAVNELIVAHLAEQTTPEELGMFLRTLHRSGATARADVVFLFPWTLTKDITRVVNEEERSFQQLILEKRATAPPHRRASSKHTEEAVEATHHDSGEADIKSRLALQVAAPKMRPFQTLNSTISPFNSKAFWKSKEERKGREDIIWESGNGHSNESDQDSSLVWGDWGSIVGFEMQDLDQDEVLKGFIEDPPAQLRRWVCYQMLLGMVKPKYRNVLLTEVAGVFILRDVLSASRKKAFDSGINLYLEDRSWNDLHRARKKKLSASIGLDDSTAGLRQSVTEGQIDKTALGLKHQETEMSIPERKEEKEPRALDGENLRRISREESGSESSQHQSPMEMHFIEELYGKDVWKSLDIEDKEKSVLGSGFVMGNMRAVRSLSNAVMTEIAAIAIKRKSRQPFHDRAILNHLVQKSSVLSRRVTGKLHMLKNGESTVHSVAGSKQANYFFQETGRGFAALLGLKDEHGVPRETATAIGRTIRDEICSSQAKSRVYEDCFLERSAQTEIS